MASSRRRRLSRQQKFFPCWFPRVVLGLAAPVTSSHVSDVISSECLSATTGELPIHSHAALRTGNGLKTSGYEFRLRLVRFVGRHP